MITPIGLEILRGAGTAEHLDVCLWRPMQKGLKSACKAGRQPPAHSHTQTHHHHCYWCYYQLYRFLLLFFMLPVALMSSRELYTLHWIYVISILLEFQKTNKQTRKQKSWALMSELNFPSEVKGFWLCEFLRFSCMNFKGLTTDFQWMLGGLGELNTRQKLQFFPLEETDCEFLMCA